MLSLPAEGQSPSSLLSMRPLSIIYRRGITLLELNCLRVPMCFYTLSGILLDMLSDLSLGSVILMVDALDECDSGLDELLKLISRDSFRSPKVKWLVASRYRPDIERWLQADAFQQKINLELNSTHISHAVNAFIDAKISELAKQKLFDNKLQEKVRNYLLENSEETFLWVSLVCKRLEVVPLWKIKL